MTRVARAAPAGYVYHVLNRAVARLPLFQKDGAYEAFERAKPLNRLADWPLPLPPDWLTIVNRPQTEAELDALRRSVNRGVP